MKTMRFKKAFAVSLSSLLVASLSGVAVADHGPRAYVTGQASVRVWLDGGDVFPGYGDVTVWVSADRDCYSTLFMVDTAGYIHVLYPNTRGHDGWMSGGRAYCYRACDLGLDRLDGFGIAYVFAVGSPVPFDYAGYGAGVFVGGFGYRVVGDPFVACREFYTSLLPADCGREYVGVGFTRFYVREWVRYPSYLCMGGAGFHVRVGDSCRYCVDAYASYRCNVADPYEVIRPVPRYKDTYRADGRTVAAIQPNTGVPSGYRQREAYAKNPAPRGAIDPQAVREEVRRAKLPAGPARVDAAPSQRPRMATGQRERLAPNERVVSTSTGRAHDLRLAKDRAASTRVSESRAMKLTSPRARDHKQADRESQTGAREKGARKPARQAQ